MAPQLASNDPSPEEQRESVKGQVEGLFSGEPMTLVAMIEAANQLENAAGVASFHTAVPWQRMEALYKRLLSNKYDPEKHNYCIFLGKKLGSDTLMVPLVAKDWQG